MRFAVTHKAATYLMVGFAYLAMTTGGGISPVVALAGFGALITSWWWEPPRIKIEKFAWVWTVASVFALAYSVLTAIVTGDFLGVGAQFLTWLIVAKAFNRRAARDWQQMYLLAFLMLVAGSVINPDLTYGLCFLGFVITSTWALTLFHLRREMEDNLLVKHAADRASERVEVQRILDSRRIVGGRFLLGTGLLSFGVFLAAAAIFLALPRVGIGFFLKSRGGLTLAGFSDGVKLGGHGVIKSDPTVVMRVEIAAQYGSRSAPQIHWRGVAFDRYENGQWKRSLGAPKTDVRTQETQTVDRRYLMWEQARFAGWSETLENVDRLVKQTILLDPLDSDVLFGAGKPKLVEYPHVARRRPPLLERNDEMRLVHGSTLQYTVYSVLAPPPVEQLQAAATSPLPKGYEVYLQLDTAITPRTRALALEITRGYSNNYDKALAIQNWLKTNTSYTLQLEDPKGQEPVDHFLFDRKKGHCEYYASAFAILARINGIPVRQVNGFLGGEWNEYQGYVAVRAGDAHSWDEVYFPGSGWVTFDPTPSGSGESLGRGGSGWRARLGRIIDALRFQWSKWVIEYDLASQLELFRSIGRGIKNIATNVKAAVVHVKDGIVEYWFISLGLGIGIAYLLLRRVRRNPNDSVHTRGAPKRHRSTVGEVYLAIAKQLTRAGFARDSATTPREVADRMVERGDPAASEVRELVELYYAAEWGSHRDPAAEDRAQKLAQKIKTALDAKKRAA
jgi:hypothetical protein